VGDGLEMVYSKDNRVRRILPSHRPTFLDGANHSGLSTNTPWLSIRCGPARANNGCDDLGVSAHILPHYIAKPLGRFLDYSQASRVRIEALKGYLAELVETGCWCRRLETLQPA